MKVMTVSREAVLHYAKRKYITEPDYPWAKFSNYAVLRHKENSKWFGLLMDVNKEKLNIEGEGAAAVLNVKCIDFKKRKWNTASLPYEQRTLNQHSAGRFYFRRGNI